jgi:hypothetical protein
MNYEEFKKEIIKCSNDEECIMAIHRSDENTRYNFKADETSMYSSLWHNPLNEGFISWKKVETMIEKGEWENYPDGKRTIMRMGDSEYIISVYFLTDVN